MLAAVFLLFAPEPDWPSVIPGFNFLSVDLTLHSTHVLSRIKMINSFFIV